MNFQSRWVPALRAIFSNNSIIKVGFQIRHSLLAIAESLSLADLAQAIHSPKNPSFIDLGYHAKLAGAIEDPSSSLDTLAGVILKKSFTPLSSHPYPWSVDLSDQAINSLYTEVDCVWQIWCALSLQESVGLKLQPEQAKSHGQLVTLVQGCKPVARGFIVGNHPGYLDIVMESSSKPTRRIKNRLLSGFSLVATKQ